MPDSYPSFGFIFDMDGVIIHNNDWHLKSWLVFAQQLGIDLKPEEFPEKVYGKTNEEILLTYFPEANPAWLEEKSLEKEALYRDMYAPHFSLAEGLLPFLAFLKENGIPVAVASNAPLVNVDFALDLGEIRPYFNKVLNAGMVARPKPAPDLYQLAARELGFLPSMCYVLEDSPTGLRAAVDAGCRPLAITSTFTAPELKRYTERVFESFAEIQRWMELQTPVRVRP